MHAANLDLSRCLCRLRLVLAHHESHAAAAKAQKKALARLRNKHADQEKRFGEEKEELGRRAAEARKLADGAAKKKAKWKALAKQREADVQRSANEARVWRACAKTRAEELEHAKGWEAVAKQRAEELRAVYAANGLLYEERADVTRDLEVRAIRKS